MVEQHLVPRGLELGRREVQWAEGLPIIESYLQYPEHLDPHIWTNLVELYVWSWPATLLQRLSWDPMPHYGALGGVSGFEMDATLDLLDYVVAEAVRMTGRTYNTDLAWQRIARLGIAQRRCPDCREAGAQGQMAMYGAIYACQLCEGVTWGGAVY